MRVAENRLPLFVDEIRLRPAWRMRSGVLRVFCG